ncbi:MAG: hypothetical protein ACE5DX_01285 [Candidatus Dojkabacteria bacterium]
MAVAAPIPTETIQGGEVFLTRAEIVRPVEIITDVRPRVVIVENPESDHGQLLEVSLGMHGIFTEPLKSGDIFRVGNQDLDGIVRLTRELKATGKIQDTVFVVGDHVGSPVYPKLVKHALSVGTPPDGLPTVILRRTEISDGL